MADTFCFYIDDSGSRDPDRGGKKAGQDQDWFGLGGVLIDESDTNTAKSMIEGFRQRWPEMSDVPLRSYDIRNRSGAFRWLNDNTARREQFMSELTKLMIELPIKVMACVIDRPGYNARYRERYGPRRWLLCRTAFNIGVERAAKFAIHDKARLRVYVERSDRKTEAQFKEYYEELRNTGLPFDVGTSAKHAPLTAEQLKSTLYEFQIKTKESSLMQIADLALWPICKGGYDSAYPPLKALREAGKLVDVHCTEENGLKGIKYSCFDATAPLEKQKPA